MPRPLRFRRQPFVPALRGDIGEAVHGGPAFSAVAPQAPRPASWLLHTGLASIPDLTARDIATFEWLATASRNADPDRTALGATRAYPVRSVLAMLESCGRKIETHEVEESVLRLFGEFQKLGRKGMLTYRLPDWSHALLARVEKYAYVDHTVLARFRRRASALLYRHLLGHVAAGRVRYDPDAPPLAVTLTTEALAVIVGMPGHKTHTGQLREKYLVPAINEIAEHVRAFSVTLDEDKVGRKVTSLTFRVRVLPPDMLETAAVRLIDKGDFSFLHAHPDVPAYRVAAKTLVRLGSTLTSRIVTPGPAGSKPHNLLNSEVHRFHRLWLVALHEALTGVLVTPAGADRPTRGASLLALIEDKGPDRAFYAWAMAEADAPDLMPAMEDRYRDVAAADLARRHRWQEFERERSNGRRVALAAERRRGEATPATPRKAKAPKAPPIVLAPPVTEAAPIIESAPESVSSLHGDVGLSADERARALLMTPEARAEARSLYDVLGLACDFPHRHGATTIGRVLNRFLEDYPTLAAADTLVEDLYQRSLAQLLKLKAAEIPGDEFEHYIALLGRAHLVPVMNGKVGPVLASLEATKSAFVRDRRAAIARLEEAAKRNAGRYVRGRPTSSTEERDLRAAPIFSSIEIADIGTYAVPAASVERDPSKLPPSSPPKAPTGFRTAPTEG